MLKTSLPILPALLLCLLMGGPVRAATFTIHADGSGDYPNIQAAADVAHDGDEIILTPGTYTGPGNRDIQLYSYAVTVRSSSGLPGGVIIDCEAGPGNPARAFCLNMEEGSGTVLEGLIMTNGYGSEAGIVAAGALLIRQGAAPTVRHCVFENNHAGMSWDHAGGAVYVDDASGGFFENCEFRGNSAYFGGAVAVNHYSTCYFVDCRFFDNEGGRGGAIWGNSTHKTRCVFARNSAEQGGAIWGNGFNEELSLGCTYWANSATQGGAIFAQQGYGGPVTLIDTIIADSLAGAAILATGAVTVQISCSDLYGNAGGDWTGGFAGQVDQDGNFSANPCFCDPGGDDFSLGADSFCLPGHHPWGCSQLVGALGEGCPEMGCAGPVNTERADWAGLKALYR